MAESGQNMDKQSEEGSSVSDTINKQGWLSKRSRLYKRWDKRWCCLKKNELSYGISAEVSVQRNQMCHVYCNDLRLPFLITSQYNGYELQLASVSLCKDTEVLRFGSSSV